MYDMSKLKQDQTDRHSSLPPGHLGPRGSNQWPESCGLNAVASGPPTASVIASGNSDLGESRRLAGPR